MNNDVNVGEMLQDGFKSSLKTLPEGAATVDGSFEPPCLEALTMTSRCMHTHIMHWLFRVVMTLHRVERFVFRRPCVGRSKNAVIEAHLKSLLLYRSSSSLVSLLDRTDRTSITSHFGYLNDSKRCFGEFSTPPDSFNRCSSSVIVQFYQLLEVDSSVPDAINRHVFLQVTVPASVL